MRKNLKTAKIYIGIFIICILCSVFYQGRFASGTEAVPTDVIIDAGHGLPDGGAVGKGGAVESEINLKIAGIIENELKKSGITVFMTRNDENGLYRSEGSSTRSKKREDLKERVKIFNGSKAKLAVSIHMNYFGAEKYSGPQLFCPKGSEESKKAADDIKKSLLSLIGDHCTREIKEVESGIYILDNCKIPIVLAECGFLSNRAEEKLLLTDEYCEKMGKAISQGIISYLRKSV